MTLKPFILTTTIGLGFAFAGTALAQDPSSHLNQESHSKAQASMPAIQTQAAGKPAFEKLDRKHRGYLLRSDVPTSMRNLRIHYGEADYNHDGRLSAPEYAAYDDPYQDNIIGHQQQMARSRNAVNRTVQPVPQYPTQNNNNQNSQQSGGH